ncbi:MAG: DUF350 domain-containing protein [Acidobacteria bacterium]|nr:DUF350 domain-containing protein [Acidobacteriota bacterium]
MLSGLLLDTFPVLWWSVFGVLALFAGTWLYDKLDPIDYRAEIAKGNMAAAIKFSAMLLGLAAIIVTAIT